MNGSDDLLARIGQLLGLRAKAVEDFVPLFKDNSKKRAGFRQGVADRRGEGRPTVSYRAELANAARWIKAAAER